MCARLHSWCFQEYLSYFMPCNDRTFWGKSKLHNYFRCCPTLIGHPRAFNPKQYGRINEVVMEWSILSRLVFLNKIKPDGGHSSITTRLSLKQGMGNLGIEESGNPIPHFKDCLCQSLKRGIHPAVQIPPFKD